MPIIFYSGSYCPYSHRCRIVLGEKQMEVDVREVDLNNKPEELALYNPYNRIPVLVDRDVKLHESGIINEYLDDRFPHPQLMPVDITLRAKVRLMSYLIDREIFSHVDTLENKTAKKQKQDIARQRIREGLLGLVNHLSKGNHYLVDKEFTILDAALAPLLWRLEHYRITLPPKAVALSKYAERVFARPSFNDSLTTIEKAMRK
ncbi:glutathione S-transferase N-terminal domain-containing protein [Candidatus Persebacteraceae bacterium Df01]|jgi:RNA polymerase-associated protein|uniref:Glutathione S-transferase N-terminal domain-containing protein n=1 Tax=Candidatus Doriopsillibacter californiensis TaxID=2970740 RepID=A0ABT7QJB4_9GAMM|nr:glutathione S-transferase N-terminal domain-containing protein [Candidatus Persebacteraceae bacterium Df01]